MTTKTCKSCNKPFEITPEDERFYKLFDVPSSNSCPDCRLQRRLMERNTKNLYWRKCDLTGEKILSQFHPDHPFPVYKTEDWWSDKWNALDYGVDFNFNRPFFEQFKELRDRIPHFAMYVIHGTQENSEYTNCTGYLKNCYMIFESDYDEDCYYSNVLKTNKDITDSFFCFDSELLYECIDCTNCYNLNYAQDCENCTDSNFLYNCKSCKNCIGCINLRHKQHCIFNKQYTPEEFAKLAPKYALKDQASITKITKETQKFFESQPHKNLQEERNENSIGDHLYNSKDAHHCIDSKDLEDCRYCARLSLGVKTSMDYNSWGDKAQMIYQSSSCGDNIYNLRFCANCMSNTSDCTYCELCISSKNLFGCAGLRNNSHCIFNKQYTPEEYKDLHDRIIAHMKETGEYGEYFPPELSTFAYNETTTMEYFPLTREEALKKGFKWRD
ncbi:hypothetical protein HOE67_04710 [Candidatus Peregrinibacteria bacterium]|jgi:hypothetical protein|nr:hypothetical protein [Candidatus Peregrinibacteria bacterium]MBT4056383.1 hypothetical protein [Candidatus Peregrinibacteria bacterium]